MPTALAEAHILAQARLRALAEMAVTTAWNKLGTYNDQDVPPFVARVAPVLQATQRQSVLLTDAFLAQALGRRPLGLNPDTILANDVRPGVTPEELYRRPFVTVWTELKGGAILEDAIHAGLARARTTAATDVQLAMRGALREAGLADHLILGYKRVPDAGACDLCQAAAGQRYTIDELFPIHAHCGCGVDVITGPERPNFTGRYENDPVIHGDGVTAAIREHGELGPVLVNADQHFSEL